MVEEPATAVARLVEEALGNANVNSTTIEVCLILLIENIEYYIFAFTLIFVIFIVLILVYIFLIFFRKRLLKSVNGAQR